ncbi:phospholipase, partial [Pseudomonas syringae pv. actinidifoliorum]|nr:phospholipase [Pseudomonas syringae pv. actinidifoliorum]
MRFAMSASASHHQKSVLVDYELPSAVGFVMGHNSLDEYWDTDDHSALNR